MVFDSLVWALHNSNTICCIEILRCWIMKHFDILRKETQSTCCLEHFLEQFSYRSIIGTKIIFYYSMYWQICRIQQLRQPPLLPYMMTNYFKVVSANYSGAGRRWFKRTVLSKTRLLAMVMSVLHPNCIWIMQEEL